MEKRLLIAKPVEAELDKFMEIYQSSVKSDITSIQEIVDYTFKADGKKIRPILLLLAAKACGEINEVTYNSAVTIELLHYASLIHDDVVDESMMRRGKASLNAIYDNKIAVLAGDYFLSTALLRSILTRDLSIISEISTLGRELAEGELNQLVLVKNLVLDEKEYFEVIRKKTASLLSVCMRIGAKSTGASAEEQDLFGKLGELLGMCFQLRDDIFDYFSDDVGKPTGNDIKEGKITLPLLYSIAQANEEEREKVEKIIFSHDYTDENVEFLINFAREKGGIEYAYEKIDEYKDQALVLIEKVTEKEVQKALYGAIDYIIDRVY